MAKSAKNSLALIKLDDEAQAGIQQASELQKRADALAIVGPESRAAAVEFRAQLKEQEAFLTAKQKKITKPAYTAWQEALDLFRGPLNDLQTAQRTVNAKIIEYESEVARKAKEAEAAIMAKHDAGQIKTETAEKRLALVVQPSKTISTESGVGVILKDVREVVVDDINLIPREYFDLNMSRLKSAALTADDNKEPLPPGIHIKIVKQLAST